MDFLSVFNLLTGVSMVIFQVVLILGVLLFIISPKKLQHPVFVWLSIHAIPLAFLVSLSALIGSVIYSDIIGFAPCNLCWIQRIFIYPQAFLFGLAWWKKDTQVIDYSLLLAAVGLIFALYHKSVEITGNSLIPCSAAVSCSKVYVNIFDYITIPVMSITTLLVLIGLMLIKKYAKTN